LYEILLQHHFFENFGERVAAGIGAVLLLFGDRYRMRVEEMAQGSVAAN